MQNGWATTIDSGIAATPNALPMITRNGTNNGAWFHSEHLWVQNEDTASLADLVERRSYSQLLSKP